MDIQLERGEAMWMDGWMIDITTILGGRRNELHEGKVLFPRGEVPCFFKIQPQCLFAICNSLTAPTLVEEVRHGQASYRTM